MEAVTPAAGIPPLESLSADLQALNAALPPTLLPTLLSQRTSASDPKDAYITSTTPSSVTITYLQPVRQYWWAPIPQLVTLAVPPLPSASNKALFVSTLEKALVNHPKISSYSRPRRRIDILAAMVFLVFTFSIVGYITGLAPWAFASEKRFNMAVMVHVVVLVRRSKEARRMSDLLARHWAGGWFGKLAWGLSAWVEGWRGCERFLRAVEKVRIAEAGEEGVKGEQKKKK